MKEDILKEFPQPQILTSIQNGIGDNIFSILIFNLIQWTDLKT